MNRQRLMVVVLGVLVLIAAWRYLAPGDDEPIVAAPASGASSRAGDPEDGGRPAPAGGAARRSGDATPATREVLDLAAAAPQGGGTSETAGRDPWRFREPPPPLPPQVRPPSAAELARLRAAEEAAARLRAEAAERARLEALIPKPPPFTLKYLGSFGPVERRLAVFTDGKTIRNVKEGGTIDGRFTVDHIGFESVDIGFVGFPDVPPQRLPAGR